MTIMMEMRRKAIEAMRLTAPPEPMSRVADLTVDALVHLAPGGDFTVVPGPLVTQIVRRLRRDGNHRGLGAAVVTGLSSLFNLEEARKFHECLFARVWEEFLRNSQGLDRSALYRVKTGITSDGSIPVELYGSEWSFKSLHMDRDALLFSHLYGPLTGFSGGHVLLVDAWGYLARHQLAFDEAFEWSQEPTAGSKPMLRRERHHDAALSEYGVNLGPIGQDAVIFVNNLPEAGILHGISPVVVTEPDSFVRVFHRCSVRQIEETR